MEICNKQALSRWRIYNTSDFPLNIYSPNTTQKAQISPSITDDTSLCAPLVL